jgi:uncharacterized protein (TIGR02266 family)
MDQPSSTESNAITLRIRFKSASLDEFIGRYGADVSPGGIFIRTKQPVEVGTTLQFDFTLGDGSPLLSGMGTVAWVRESDPARANNVPGMGLRFDKLTLESQHTHQLILAEKARKEGKASSTPYPPTSFVAPPARVSPAPEATKPAQQPAVKTDPGPSNLAVTRPAPAAAIKAATPPPASAIVEPPSSFGESGEFWEGGKTEISEKPLDYYMKEAEKEARAAKEAEEGRRHEIKTAEEAVPQSWLDGLSTGTSAAPITRSGPPPEGFNEPEREAGFTEKPASAGPSDGARKSGSREAFASLVDLGADGNSTEGQTGAPSGEVLPELSAGVPLEETVPEKTEEVSMLAAAAPLKGPEPLDLGTGRESGFGDVGDDRPPSRDDVSSLKPKKSGKAIAVIAIAAAAAAFGAVYLAKAKPWQGQAKPEAPVIAATRSAENPPAPAPAPVPPPAKPVAEEEQAAKRPAAEEPKPVVAVAEQDDKKAAEKPAETAEKKEPEKPAPEKVVAKGDGEPARSPGKPAAKAAAKSDEKPSGAANEEIFRLVIRSSPISAEVLIDGEYFSRTPCERRILEPSKTFAVIIRKEGYEPHERLVGPSDNWAKKGEERVLTVTASLKKAKTGENLASPPPPAAATEAKSDKKADMLLAKPESPSIEAAKAAASAKVEPAKPVVKEPAKAEPAAPKPEPAKSAAPAAKPLFKPAPDFDDQGKAKE